jgi:UDP-N-acetylmuramyl tripeptide synthase
MGAIASKLADEVIVTSDNPRSEDPLKIIRQIQAGLSEPFAIEEQRDTAIKMSINSAHSGDIVLIAGKGHEDYQEIAGVKHPFSDALIAQAALAQYQTSGLGASL